MVENGNGYKSTMFCCYLRWTFPVEVLGGWSMDIRGLIDLCDPYKLYLIFNIFWKNVISTDSFSIQKVINLIFKY